MSWTVEERILEAVMHTEGLTRWQLSQLIHVPLQRINLAIGRLEADGVIERVEAWAMGDKRNVAA